MGDISSKYIINAINRDIMKKRLLLLYLALLAIMVVDIQREYRFYSEKEEIRLQKNMDIRRKYVGIARRVRSTQNRPAAASDLRG